MCVIIVKTQIYTNFCLFICILYILLYDNILTWEKPKNMKLILNVYWQGTFGFVLQAEHLKDTKKYALKFQQIDDKLVNLLKVYYCCSYEVLNNFLLTKLQVLHLQILHTYLPFIVKKNVINLIFIFCFLTLPKRKVFRK